jgi:hypothetical protein
MTFDNQGNLYASSGSSILKFTSTGVRSTYYSSSSSLTTPWGITMDSSNNLFGVDFSKNTLFEITSTGTFISTVLYNNRVNSSATPEFPTGIVAANGGGFYITFNSTSTGLLWMASLNYQDQRDTVLATYGSSGIGGIVKDSNGNLYSAHSGYSTTDGYVSRYPNYNYVTGFDSPAGLAVGPYIVAEPNSLITTILGAFSLASSGLLDCKTPQENIVSG